MDEPVAEHVILGAETGVPRSNVEALWSALKAFFKDNPGFELPG
jgi:hypothetical protein